MWNNMDIINNTIYGTECEFLINNDGKFKNKYLFSDKHKFVTSNTKRKM